MHEKKKTVLKLLRVRDTFLRMFSSDVYKYIILFSLVRIMGKSYYTVYGKNEFTLNETNGNEITNKGFNYTTGNFIMWVMKKRVLMEEGC